MFAGERRDSGGELEMALDHFVSQSVYFCDLKGNRIKVFVNMPRMAWEHILCVITYGAPLPV